MAGIPEHREHASTAEPRFSDGQFHYRLAKFSGICGIGVHFPSREALCGSSRTVGFGASIALQCARPPDSTIFLFRFQADVSESLAGMYPLVSLARLACRTMVHAVCILLQCELDYSVGKFAHCMTLLMQLRIPKMINGVSSHAERLQ